MSVQTQANGIQETLCSASPFTVPSSIDLFLFLSKSLSSMSNPLWCSHVCWSCARVAWDYHGWRHTHIRTHMHTRPIYTLPNFSLHYVGYRRNVPGDVRVDCRGPIWTRGNLLYGTGSGKPLFPPPIGLYQGKMI